MSNEGVVYLLMVLNVDAYVDVILERSLRSNEGHIGVDESLFTMMREVWTRVNVCFLWMNSKRCIKVINIHVSLLIS